MIIEITGVTSGTSPYDVFLCTWDLNNCFFVSGSVSIPPTVQIDSNDFFPNEELLQLKIIDGAGCVFTEPLPCTATPTPTPTATPTLTPTPTPCVYNEWEINLGSPCTFNLFDCDQNVYDTVTFSGGGTYYVCSVYEPQNETACAISTITVVGPCTPTPTPTATPTPTPSPTPTNTPIPTPEPTPTPVPCLQYSVYNLYDNMLELNFEPCCGEVNISPYGLVGQTTVTFCSTTYPTTSSPSTITLLGNCPNC